MARRRYALGYWTSLYTFIIGLMLAFTCHWGGQSFVSVFFLFCIAALIINAICGLYIFINKKYSRDQQLKQIVCMIVVLLAIFASYVFVLS